MKASDLAYCAGIVDADGTIGIRRSTYAMRVRGDAGCPIYSERVCVKQVEPQAVDLLHGLFGGYRFRAKPNARRGRALEGWQVTDKQAAAFLRAVFPYLRIKRAQAHNCLALRVLKEKSKRLRVARGRGHAGGAARTDALGAAMESLCAHAHELNTVGA